MREVLQSTAGLSYAEQEHMSRLDRAPFNAALRRRVTGLSYELNAVLDAAGPEACAEAFAAEMRSRQRDDDAACLLFPT